MIVRKTGIIVYNSNKQVIRQSDNSKDFFKKFIVEVFMHENIKKCTVIQKNEPMHAMGLHQYFSKTSIGNFF